jgi:hypothetical protein
MPKLPRISGAERQRGPERLGFVKVRRQLRPHEARDEGLRGSHAQRGQGGHARWHLAAGRGLAERVLGSAARVTSNVKRLMACRSVFAGPEDGTAPSLMLDYQKSRHRRTALGLACMRR